MSKTADHIDAIAVGLATLTRDTVLNRSHERARASLIEKSLNEFGFVIVPMEPTEEMWKAGHESGDWGPSGYDDHPNGAADPNNCYRAMIAAASTPSGEAK